MNQPLPHARAFDLPGWPCPPRLRDIPHHENSWGWINVGDVDGPDVAQDETGHLWVRGSCVPVFTTPDDADQNPGGLVFWTADGIGLWIHRKSLKLLSSVSQLDMPPDEWLPVRKVAAEWPAFIKESA